MNYAGAGLLILSPDLKQILLVHDARSRKWGFPKVTVNPTIRLTLVPLYEKLKRKQV